MQYPAYCRLIQTLCLETLEQFGWKTSGLVSTEAYTLPEIFDASYDIFLVLQTQAGFNLMDYAEKTVTRYTYRIENYPGGSDYVYADLLVYRDQVIGGDIRSANLDGFMSSLCFPEN